MIVITLLLAAINTFAQIKNIKTETVNINGECDMCKTAIEKAGNMAKVVQINWDAETKQATLKYDTTRTNREEILKRIALIGYDNEDFLAPSDTYKSLPECCQYKREVKVDTKTISSNKKEIKTSHSHNQKNDIPIQLMPLQSIFERYFAIKDALVQTNEKLALENASTLLTEIKAVDMNKLSSEEHKVWMSLSNKLVEDVETISLAKSASKQREVFNNLSNNIYALAKVSKSDSPIHYQHCPMFNSGKGAYWLSKDSSIKNPYFGSKMLTCGTTVETLVSK